jgi:hypothetical protein
VLTKPGWSASGDSMNARKFIEFGFSITLAIGWSGAIACIAKGIISATRESCSSARPMWKSMPSGSASSSRQYVPTLLPEIRRITSPTSQPKVTAW